MRLNLSDLRCNHHIFPSIAVTMSMVLGDLAGALIIFCGYSAPIDICFEPRTLTLMCED